MSENGRILEHEQVALDALTARSQPGAD